MRSHPPVSSRIVTNDSQVVRDPISSHLKQSGFSLCTDRANTRCRVAQVLHTRLAGGVRSQAAYVPYGYAGDITHAA